MIICLASLCFIGFPILYESMLSLSTACGRSKYQCFITFAFDVSLPLYGAVVVGTYLWLYKYQSINIHSPLE